MNVSVIVPVYNVQPFLDKCIRSILAQTYEDFELILVDDGSTDDCPRICDEYAQADERITVIHKRNGGLSSARNAGLDSAVGKYIYFVDSDDYIEPQLLERAVFVMESQQCDWCGFAMQKEDLQGNLLETVTHKPVHLCLHTQDERMAFLLKYLLNYRIGWEACTHLYRGDIIREKKLRFISERIVFAEDLLFSFSYWLYAASCVIIEEPLYHYVQRTDSLMEKSRQKNILPQIRALTEAAYQAVENAGLAEIQKDFAILYLHLMEWHSRQYVAEKGPEWLKNQVSKFPYSLDLRRAFQKYGCLDGVVTVVVTAVDEISPLFSQTLQKLDVLLLTPAPAELPVQDPRVRQVICRDQTPSGILQAAFREGWGEYLCFADRSSALPPRYLELLSDAAKYNECGTAVCAAPPVFFDRDSLAHRREFRKLLGSGELDIHSMLIRRDLLEESGLGCMEDLWEYLPELLLTGHIIFYKCGT